MTYVVRVTELYVACVPELHVKASSAYTKRRVHYFDEFIERYKSTEAIMFPCSTNGEDVDYGITFIEYAPTFKAPDEKIFRLL